jgi:hypothetical protein
VKKRDLDHCAVCGLKIADEASELCSLHSEAFSRIKDAYSHWVIAYGNLSIEDFLNRLIALSETGDRARTVAKYLIVSHVRWR